ncbi:CBP80/20-dependent translation initiation factor isoform X2 [Megalops cyprinoides]|uniref:CBP80/20-dependent translation initiation factor isoform X2 n=1 Tax=Megalops cyprinoides TaxID=118141 RepID=UPI0018653EB0|nr:CBP80/20-dependent translation initiation factor isoform X2 [Megalops cyprinoides]
MENSSVASASSEAGSTRSQEIEELERFIDSYVLEYQVQGLLSDKSEADGDGEKTQSHVSQWTEDCSDKIDGSWSSSRGRGSSKPDDWEHSSNGSTGSRPSSGSRPGSGSRSGSRGRNSQFRGQAKNGNREGSFDILGTDIWAANTLDSHGGATWDLQPEKLDFTQFHRKAYRGTPKHLPHIDREGMMKGKFDDDDGIDLNDMEKFLPGLTVFPPLSNEAEIAHTKKLFRRRRNDRRHPHLSQDQLTVMLPAGGKRQVTRRQQRPPGGGKSQNSQQQSPQQQQQQQQPQQQPAPQQQQQQQGQQQNAEHAPGGGKHGREHGRQFQGQGPHPSGRQGPAHHGYSQNRRWHHNQKHQGAMAASPGTAGEKGAPRNAKETESAKAEETRPDPGADKGFGEGPVQSPFVAEQRRDSYPDGPKVSLLQSSKERLRRRLKEKDEAPVATTNPQRNRMDKLMEILSSMRNNSSEVDGQLTTFMEEAQNSTSSEEMLSEIVRTIYQKAVSDRSFASTAAKLCDKMALFMVEGTKFRSLLLNMLQKDFTRREELQQSDVERWLGFITFLCEVFGIMRSSAGEPFRVLVCPIYTCLRELLESAEVKEDAVLCCSMELQSTGRLLEEQLPEMMTELLAAARDKMLCPSESQLTRSLLMEVIELHAHQWNPLEALTTQYYNRTIQKLTA